jgi:hypothetical protein
MIAPRVYNRRDSGIPKDAVYVGRPSPWGNPYAMVLNKAPNRVSNEPEERERVCDAFEAYAIAKHAAEPGWLKPLRGKSLICYCSPKRCHAETLLRLANEGTMR